MKSYLDLPKKMSKINKNKNRITVLCIAISVSLVVAIFGMLDLAIQAQIKSAIETQGNYDISVHNISDEVAENIGKRVDVEAAGWCYSPGGGASIKETRNSDISVFIMVNTMSQQTGETIMNLEMLQGSYPKTKDEVLINEKAMQTFNWSIGDTLTFEGYIQTESQTSNNDTINYTAHITGTYKDVDSMGGGSYSSNGLFQSIGAIFAPNVLDEYYVNDIYSGNNPIYYVRFKKGTNAKNAINSILSEYNLKEADGYQEEEGGVVNTNGPLLLFKGGGYNKFAQALYIVAFVLIAMVVMSGVLMISSSFNMALRERIQYFGLLRCVGTSKKQVKRMIYTEAFYQSIQGIPLGIVIGQIFIFLSCFIFRYISSTISFGFEQLPLFSFSWKSWLVGIVVDFITVFFASRKPAKMAAKISPMAAIKGEEKLKINAPYLRKNIKKRRLTTALGMSHALYNKHNAGLIIGSFAFSIILFLGFQVLVSGLEKGVLANGSNVADVEIYQPNIDEYTKDGVLIDYGNEKYDEDFWNDESNYTRAIAPDRLTPELIEQIKAVPGVNDVSKECALGRFSATIQQKDGSQQNKQITLLSYSTSLLKQTNKVKISGNFNNVFKGSETAAIANYTSKIKQGDTVILKGKDGSDIALVIEGVVANFFNDKFNTYDYSEGGVSSELTPGLIVSQQVYEKLDIKEITTVDPAPMYDEVSKTLQVYFNKGVSAEDTLAKVKEILPTATYAEENFTINREARIIYYTGATFVYGFLVVLALITIFNILNTIDASVSVRKKEYGVMRAVGMSIKQLKQMVVSEACTYAILGAIAGTVVGVIFNAVAYYFLITANWGLRWAVPIVPIGIILLVCVFSIFISTKEPLKKIKKSSIVESIKTP